MSHQAKVIKGGKIVIPREFRRQLGFKDGDDVCVELEGNKLIVQTRTAMLAQIRSQVKSALKRPISVDSYLKEKWAEADNE
jgi:AbrB family transcriptional regulator, stage V sporulation protein T